MPRTLCAIALLLPLLAHAALEQRDIDADGTVDAVYDSAADLTWQAAPGSFRWFVNYYAHEVEVAGTTGWQLPSAVQVEQLVYTSMGNTPDCFEAGTFQAGPFDRNALPMGTWTANLMAGPDDTGESYWIGGGVAQVGIYEYLPAWLVREGDVPCIDAVVAPAPEPSTWALMALGLAGVAASGRRRRARS